MTGGVGEEASAAAADDGALAQTGAPALGEELAQIRRDLAEIKEELRFVKGRVGDIKASLSFFRTEGKRFATKSLTIFVAVVIIAALSAVVLLTDEARSFIGF